MASGDKADSLTCSVCLERYKNPRFLRCYHSFCEQCLKSLAQTSARCLYVECPKCRKVTQLPSDGVSHLQPNFPMMRRLDSAADGEVCQIHPALKLRYYCVTCDVIICSDCMITQAHKKHDAEDLKSAVSAAKKQLQTDKLRLEQVSETLKKHLVKIHANEAHAEDQRQSVENQLQKRAKTLHKWVDEALAEALRSLGTTSKNIREQLRQARSEAEGKLRQIQKIEADVNRALSSSSSQKLLSLRTDMRSGRGSQERLRQLTSNLHLRDYDYPVLLSNGDCLHRDVIAQFIGEIQMPVRKSFSRCWTEDELARAVPTTNLNLAAEVGHRQRQPENCRSTPLEN
ncbi:hypothetical protein BaRGS_00022260 [Batillaria attramentaria]|uniref:Uncharacterized protein n=1 Tax=Batillaria attramentaria TaxID=370345 RepID=A0ABD0KH41_9CAEN